MGSPDRRPGTERKGGIKNWARAAQSGLRAPGSRIRRRPLQAGPASRRRQGRLIVFEALSEADTVQKAGAGG